MGLKGLMSEMGMNAFAVLALVLFFGSFLAILLWTMTRSRREIEAHANIPLQDDDE